MRTDYEQSSIAYDVPATRVDRFEEAVTVIKGLMAPGPFSFSGTHYTIDGHDGLPKPSNNPIPLAHRRRRAAVAVHRRPRRPTS